MKGSVSKTGRKGRRKGRGEVKLKAKRKGQTRRNLIIGRKERLRKKRKLRVVVSM